jgi:N-acetylmuramoyl-L-alanine amidase
VAQIEAALAVAEALQDAYDFEDVLGHDDISWDRKTDPGPAFPMISFRSRIVGRSDD